MKLAYGTHVLHAVRRAWKWHWFQNGFACKTIQFHLTQACDSLIKYYIFYYFVDLTWFTWICISTQSLFKNVYIVTWNLTGFFLYGNNVILIWFRSSVQILKCKQRTVSTLSARSTIRHCLWHELLINCITPSHFIQQYIDCNFVKSLMG